MLKIKDELEIILKDIPSPKNCTLNANCLLIDFDKTNFEIYLDCYPEMESQVQELLNNPKDEIKGIEIESGYFIFSDPSRGMRWRAKGENLKKYMGYE